MKTFERAVIALTAILLFYAGSSGDTLTLRDGRIVEGQYAGRSEGYISFRIGDRTERVSSEELVSLILDRPWDVETVNLVDVAPGSIALAVQKIASDARNAHECTKKCKDGHEGDSDWGMACIDYCNCIHIDKQSKETCAEDFKEDTGKDPPLALPSPSEGCGDCLMVIERLKTCVEEDALGPNEDLVVTVPCGQATPPYWKCRPCLQVFWGRRTCCQNGRCWSEPCGLPSVALP